MRRDWRLLSSHGQVLLYLAQHPDVTIREISAALEVSQRQADLVVRDLQDAGILTITRVGRRNSYDIDGQAALRHPGLANVSLADVVALFRMPESRGA